MRYVWLTSAIPYPPQIGGMYDYTRGVIESLAQIVHVRALAYGDPADSIPASSRIDWNVLPLNRRSVVGGLLSGLPNVAYRNRQRHYLKYAVGLATEAEVLIVDFIAMAWLVQPLEERVHAMGRRAVIIMVTHNHEGKLRMQMARKTKSPLFAAALAYDAWKAARLERIANRAANGVTAITTTDRDTFSRQTGRLALLLPPTYEGPRTHSRQITSDTPRTVAILGNRNSHHKLLVLHRTLKVFSAVGLERRIDIEIGGAGDLSRCEAEFPNFKFRGYIHDLSDYCSGIRIGLITDDVGGGFKLRAMSYAFLRVPMIALHEAMEGMGFENDVHYIGAHTLDELAQRTLDLIDDCDRLNILQNAAYAFANERFHPAAAGRALAQYASELASEL